MTPKTAIDTAACFLAQHGRIKVIEAAVLPSKYYVVELCYIDDV